MVGWAAKRAGAAGMHPNDHSSPLVLFLLDGCLNSATTRNTIP